MSYPLIELSELILKRNGSVNPTKFLDETFELHSIPAFDKGHPEILKGSDIGSSKQIVQENDVMISKIVPHIRRASVVPKAGIFRQIASSEWIVFRSERFVPNYLKHVLVSDSFNTEFMATVSGVGGSLLRARPAFVEKIKIPFPPLEEQCRIAAILDQANALRQKCQQSLEKLDQLLQAAFIEMFGDPVSNPKGWRKLIIKDLIKVQNGYAFPSSSFTSSGIPVVKIGNANKSGFNLDKIDYVLPENAKKLVQYELKPGDLLLSLTGTVGKDDYGNITKVSDEFQLYYLNQRVAKLEIINQLVTKNYIYGFFSQQIIKNNLTLKSRGVRQANISNSDIYGLEIPIPDLDTQNKFQSLENHTSRLKSKIELELIQLNFLFESIQQKAFTGRL